jgi:hypothetical protein
MEFWLEGSLFHELFFLFSRWNSGNQGAFLTNFLFFLDGILGIMKPFSRTLFFLFSRWNSGYQGAFLTNFFSFHDGILAIKEPFSRTFFSFHDGILEIRNLGKTLFIYIYISQRVLT